MSRYNPDSNFDEFDGPDFADPGGRSSLRAARKGNPRNRSCPTYKRRNVLTPADVALRYQCGACADAVEGGYGFPSAGDY